MKFLHSHHNIFILTASILVAIIGIFLYLNVAHADEVEPKRPKNPMMRVLLGDALAPTTFTSNGDFVVENEDGNIFFTIPKNGLVNIQYADGLYSTAYNGVIKTAKKPLRVTPVKYRKKITVTNFENRPEWDLSLNDNEFFGSVEVVYSDNSQKALLVNELGIEKYVRGIAEASNTNEPEYLKALLTAARTYSLFHITHPTKHALEPYIVDATPNDQVYKGAGFSRRAPNIRAAQKATVGEIITYDGVGIIAPYFSQTDGRTRSWDEIWGGEQPWSQSVDDPCCTGKTLQGHGVGMSAAGARYFASEEGWEYKKILKYYYSGVEIETSY